MLSDVFWNLPKCLAISMDNVLCLMNKGKIQQHSSMDHERPWHQHMLVVYSINESFFTISI